MVDPLSSAEERFGLHYHARAATIWVVVRRMVLVCCVMADVVQAHLHMARLGRPLEDTRPQHTWKHLREEGQDVEQQGSIVLIEEVVECRLIPRLVGNRLRGATRFPGSWWLLRY